MSIKDCQNKCDEMEGCTAVSIGNDGSCYRKSDVVPDQCDIAPGQFDTYVKSEWVHAKGFNCWGSRGGGKSHGSTDLEVPADSSAGIMSLEDCQKKCSETAGCDAVTVEKSGDLYNCFRKGYTQIALCDHGTTFDTYIHAGAFSVGDLAQEEITFLQ